MDDDSLPGLSGRVKSKWERDTRKLESFWNVDKFHCVEEGLFISTLKESLYRVQGVPFWARLIAAHTALSAL